MTIHILFDLFLIIALIGAYIYNDKTGKITEFEQKLWKAFCRKVNHAIRNYERRKNYARSI